MNNSECPYLAIATDGAEVRQALSQQIWRDVRIVDDMGLARRQPNRGRATSRRPMW